MKHCITETLTKWNENRVKYFDIRAFTPWRSPHGANARISKYVTLFSFHFVSVSVIQCFTGLVFVWIIIIIYSWILCAPIYLYDKLEDIACKCLSLVSIEWYIYADHAHIQSVMCLIVWWRWLHTACASRESIHKCVSWCLVMKHVGSIVH